MTSEATRIDRKREITAVVNLHQEGASAEPSIISAWRAMGQCNDVSLSANLLLALDSPDEATVALAEKWRDRGVDVLTIHEGDLGEARNAAAAQTDAKWIAYLDGDDLWGENWLVTAHAAAQTAADRFDVFHPQVNIIFGDHHSLLHHIDSDSDDFRWSRFCLHNAWTALSFVQRELVAEMPYPRNELESGFGFEDWSWNMAVLDAGGRHRVVPDTCHFIRRTNDGSLLADSQQALRTRYPHLAPSPERNLQLRDLPQRENQAEVSTSTHRDARVELTPEILEQVRLAATIEPAVSHTLSADGTPRSLPQNFNTHDTAAQSALEELWVLRGGGGTVGEICDRSTLLVGLPSADRIAVVAEFLLAERALGRATGESALIAEAADVYSQLASAP